METLTFYTPGLYFHPLHFHCLLSIKSFASIHAISPTWMPLCHHRLQALHSIPPSDHFTSQDCEQRSSSIPLKTYVVCFPFLVFCAKPPLRWALHSTWTYTCILPNTTFPCPFWFYTCCSIHLAYHPSNSSSGSVVFQGSAQICFCYEDALMALIHQVIPSSVASHITIIDPRMHSLGCIRCLCFSTQQSQG